MKKLIALLICITVILLIPIQILEVRAVGTEELVYQQQVIADEEFSIRWMHSVTLQPVIETYRLEAPDRIPLVKMEFDDFGPNLPSQPFFDQKWTFKDGKIIVTNYDIVFERVPVTIGAVTANHTLIYNEKKVMLKDIFSPGGSVNIGFVEKNIFKYVINYIELFFKNESTNNQ